MGLLNEIFYHIGKGVARHPFIVFFGAIVVTTACGLGFLNFRVTSDPQELWVPKSSRANIEQDYFKNHFGEFFRINEMMIVPADSDKSTQDIFRPEYLNLLYYLQKAVEEGTIEKDGHTYGLEDFCYKPITGKGCLVTSPMGFWKMNKTAIPTTAEQVKIDAQCIPKENESGRVWFDRIGVPVQVTAIFGGTTCVKDDSQPCAPCRIDASAYMVTFLLNNNEYSNPIAEQWELEVFQRNVKTFNLFANYHTELPDGVDDYNQELYDQLNGVYNETSNSEMLTLKIDYLSERSIPDQLVEIGDQNKFVIALSYLLMFVYVGLALGYFPSFVHNRFLLGLGGIFVVLFSLVIAIGITLYMNIPLSLISSEVVPFLILAIGVDNMFIIVRAEQEVEEKVENVDERVALALKEVGPSIFTAAFCESLAFFVGMLTKVPALESFCLVAAIGVLADFLLQITFFCAALSLDARRINDNRCDILPCIRREKKTKPRKAIVRTLFQKYYVPFLFNKKVELWVYFVSLIFFALGITACWLLDLGLTQNVSLIDGSDTFEFFNTFEQYGEVGPPAYLVFKNVNYTDNENIDTLAAISDGLSQLNDTVIKPVYSWVKSFQQFRTDGEWAEDWGSTQAMNLGFDDAMSKFVNIKIDSDWCQFYGIWGEQYIGDIVFNDDGKVVSTRFRFQHTMTKTDDDYTRALVETRRVSDQFASSLHTLDGIQDDEDSSSEVKPVFAYSLFYVYYDQYTYIRGILAEDTLLAMAAVLLAIEIITNVWIAMFVVLCVFLVSFELLGLLWLSNQMISGFEIQVNAVTVVNIVMALGFSVEFCVHIAIAFNRFRGTRLDRAKRAIFHMGSSVLVGIGSTKFIGVLVLAFAPSTLFRLYYFRMYFCIIILGLFNGLMVIPLLLSRIGPKPQVQGKQHKS